ncbi:MAG TPA: HDIG domain-containing metalloprotein [Limnochordales bacterium]
MTKKPNGTGGQGAGRPGGAHRAWASFRAAVWTPVARFFGRPSAARRGVLAGVLFVVLLAVMAADTAPDALDWQVGDVATRDVAAPRDVVNRYRTEQLREQAAREAVREAELDPVNWEINPAEALRAEERVKAIFGVIASLRQEALAALAPQAEEGVAAGQPPGAGAASESAAGGERQAPGTGGDGAAGDGGTGDPAAAAGDPATPAPLPAPALPVDELAARAAELLSQQGITLARDVLVYGLQLDDETRAAVQERAVRIAADLMSRRRIAVDDLQREQEAVFTQPQIAALPPSEQAFVGGIVQAVLRPNLIPSPERMERARQEAMRAVAEVRVREGQIIIRRGDPVGPEHIMLLQDLGLLDGRYSYAQLAGQALLLVLLFAVAGVYLHQHRRDILMSERQLALLGLIVLLVAGLAKVGSFIAWEGTALLVPVGLSALLVTLLLDSRLAIVTTLVLSTIVAAMFGFDGRYFLVALAGGVAGVYSVSRVSQRSDLTRAGLFVGGACFMTMLALGLMRSEMFLIQYSFLGLLNGIVSAVGTIGLLPYLETVFGITSSIRLLELSNPNHPLLRKLLMEAPGTYHHSILVGNLAEAAAEAIGADQLLVRVGAQYHDIGKTKRPYFFVENQFGGENPHDKLSPTLSTLIIISHVRDGVELAREYHLPQVIVDFIREHHGTDLVKYFYQKAVENAKGEPVDEKDFRYPGPRPQSKETALVMLADAVEASVRSLGRPTPGRIEGFVRRIIRERLEAGELDESDLTLKDLDKIADAFVRVLTGIFHKRVEYPDMPVKDQDLKRLKEGEARRADPARSRGDREAAPGAASGAIADEAAGAAVGEGTDAAPAEGRGATAGAGDDLELPGHAG